MDRGNRPLIGKVAGTPSGGYTHIILYHKAYLAHRLAWFYMLGVWPSKGLDHIDLDRYNNTFTNLREATQIQNCYNVGLTIRNSSGYKGVHQRKDSGKFVANCGHDGILEHLGTFDTALEASEAYQACARQNHGAFLYTESVNEQPSSPQTSEELSL